LFEVEVLAIFFQTETHNADDNMLDNSIWPSSGKTGCTNLWLSTLNKEHGGSPGDQQAGMYFFSM
jgi:hypothetical protein